MAPRKKVLNPRTPEEQARRRAKELIRCHKDNELIAALNARGVVEATALGGFGHEWRIRNPNDPTMVPVKFSAATGEIFQGGQKLKKMRGISSALKAIGVEFTE